ncbi:MAG: MarR family transcriptional regulator [Phyllobacteriaceae bacterium]|nr:MarR family transcriptional regulator [Phyllobacteriaceae bacterium]
MEIYEMPGHLIRRMQQIAVSIFADRISNAGYDLTPVQFACLNALEAHPGVDQATLAGLIAYDRVTIGGVVDRLEAKGLVTRTVNKNDRRSRVLKLTAAGAGLLSDTRQVVRQTQADILQGLSGKEAATFVELLQKAVSAAEGESRAPFRPREPEARK